MRGPKPQAVTLTERQRALLERLARRQTSPAALVRRARIVLRAVEGERNERMARELGCAREQVRVWRGRWVEASERLAALEESGACERELMAAVAAALADRPRSGRPPTFTAEQVCQILALACEEPTDSGREGTHWTPRELAEEAVRRGIVETISARTVGRFFDLPPSSRIASAIG